MQKSQSSDIENRGQQLELGPMYTCAGGNGLWIWAECFDSPRTKTAKAIGQQTRHPSLIYSFDFIHWNGRRDKTTTTDPERDPQAFSRRLPEISLGHLLLPLLPVPRRHVDAAHTRLVEAPVIDVVTFRVTPRDRQRGDAAVLAEHVLGRSRSEPVDLEVFFAVEGFERGFVDDETLEACGRWEM